ncbi:rhodanese-like domain-containing protein [Rhodoferax sp.]|uniref:rhodanese-like domain-containing protein n=1 Tax=Rhodoferax sp. TaxID=50421 RepID=UPI002607D33F|nr:rhodanese-like domain-containing protein [Rhodoferax sp.]MDD5002030.1 rhodanese-like domain-containing protein [Thiomonas arsenitoxydans]MDD5480287.1 rhodanese-like domain-containing protein [Rhodoferax sp.]
MRFPHRLFLLKWVAVVLALMGTCAVAQPAASVLINPGDQGEKSRFLIYNDWKNIIEQVLRKEKVTPVSVTQSTDARADLAATRSRIPDVLIAPAHIIGSAARYGYTPILGFDRPQRAVLVTSKDSAVQNLAQAQGKSLGLPPQDSVVTYLVRGEVNAANTTIKRHFSGVYETRYQDALLMCLQLRRCEVVAVERELFDRWVAAGEPVKIIMETRTVPSLTVALKNGSRPGAEALRAALTDGMTAVPGAVGAKTVALAAKDFEYVSTLGYFTPRTLPGATLIDAAGVAKLVKQKDTYLIDTRNKDEFKAGHLPGAKWVPYVEKSAKEPDYVAKADQFDLGQLPANKASTLVFSCNGPECWKSFKASDVAVKAGYTQVRWFRGGFPEWRDAGFPVDMGG